MPEGIPSAVVTYFPDTGLADRLRAIRRESSQVLVTDNTTDPAARLVVEAATKAVGSSYLGLPSNGGVAGGLNAAFAQFRIAGHRWAIAFDQDSIPEPGFSAALLHHATTTGCRIVGADWYDRVNPSRHAKHLQPMRWLPFLFGRRSVPPEGLASVTFAISSGTLFNLELWEQLRGFDPQFPLDYADIDFCLRARRIGARTGIAAGARLAHNRGHKRPVRRFGRTWWPANIPPARLEHLVTRQIRMVGRHGWRFPHWALYEACHLLKLSFDATVLEPRSLPSLRAIGRGLRRSLHVNR
jgi:rhamnosyltransferase